MPMAGGIPDVPVSGAGSDGEDVFEREVSDAGSLPDHLW